EKAVWRRAWWVAGCRAWRWAASVQRLWCGAVSGRGCGCEVSVNRSRRGRRLARSAPGLRLFGSCQRRGDVQRLRGVGDFGAVAFDDAADGDQHVLLDLVELRPVGGVGEGVDHDVERAGREGVEVDDQGLAGVDFRMAVEHAAD